MGQAMARALMAGGHPVTVWNRTPSRADGLVADGATRADSPAAAVAASDLVILSLTDYQAMDDILGPVGPGLAGHTIVNLSSDTPERTRRAAAWAAGLGARFLTGGVMVPAPMVGTEAAYVYYSGPRSSWTEHAATLGLIGGAPLRRRGPRPGAAVVPGPARRVPDRPVGSAARHRARGLRRGSRPPSSCPRRCGHWPTSRPCWPARTPPGTSTQASTLAT